MSDGAIHRVGHGCCLRVATSRTVSRMSEILIARAQALKGVFSTADARAAGVNANDLRALVRAGTAVRVAPRAYVLGRAHAAATMPEELHRLETLAVLRSFDNRVAASHHSALALHRLPFWRVNTDEIHVCRRTGRSSRVRGRLHIHESVTASPLMTSQLSGELTTSPALAVIGTAMANGVEAGVVAMDAALHAAKTSEDELTVMLSRMRLTPGITSARQALSLADARAESPGETRTRLILTSIPGSPEVLPQFEVRTPGGELVGRADFRVGTKVLVEFDGRAKYGMDGRRREDDLWAEKLREDRLRALGYVVVRLVWADLDRPRAVIQRVLAALRVAEGT